MIEESENEILALSKYICSENARQPKAEIGGYDVYEKRTSANRTHPSDY